jgi:hypothetical protein
MIKEYTDLVPFLRARGYESLRHKNSIPAVVHKHAHILYFYNFKEIVFTHSDGRLIHKNKDKASPADSSARRNSI